ncbi:MAG: hypothetical protein WDA16_05910 [Candidatus Thermoplasmatota archaeon]
MARVLTLTKAFSESVATFANVANAFTPIVRITTPKSRLYTFKHGLPVVLKLATNAGVEVGANSRMVWVIRRPTQRSGADITGVMNYRAWRSIPLSATGGEKTQYDIETSANRRVYFLTDSDIQLPQDHVMEWLLNSPDAVDFNHANTDFEYDIEESDVLTQVAQ